MTAPDLLPHSAEEFDVRRNYLWNPDFLALMGRRWALDGVRDALDVGCGIGHWTAQLSLLLPAAAKVVGVDREPAWVEIATRVARQTGRHERTRFQAGSVETLDFPDDGFDLVTCQTLLIHVADPVAALREMRRVLRPGGLLAVVEPNNLVQTLVPSSTTADDEADAVLSRVRFQLLCERGRRRLGEGDISLGDRIPGFLGALGMKDIQVFVSDKASSLVPPYSGEEQRALAQFQFETPPSDRWLWSRQDTQRYFAAGGGTEAEFASLWDEVVLRVPARLREAYGRSDYARAGGRLVYLVSGRK